MAQALKLINLCVLSGKLTIREGTSSIGAEIESFEFFVRSEPHTTYFTSDKGFYVKLEVYDLSGFLQLLYGDYTVLPDVPNDLSAICKYFIFFWTTLCCINTFSNDFILKTLNK